MGKGPTGRVPGGGRGRQRKESPVRVPGWVRERACPWWKEARMGIEAGVRGGGSFSGVQDVGGALEAGEGARIGGTPRVAGGKEIQGKESALRAASEGLPGPDRKRKLGRLQAAQSPASWAQKGVVLERRRGFLT